MMKTGIVSKIGLGLGSMLLLLGGCIDTMDAGDADDASLVGVDKKKPRHEAPEIYFGLNATNFGCSADPGERDTFCDGAVLPGDVGGLYIQIHWRDEPGSYRVFDNCFGEVLDLHDDGSVIEGSWQAPSVEIECSLFLDVFDDKGDVLSRTLLHYPVGPQPEPPAIHAYVILLHTNGSCRLVEPGQTEIQCDPVLQSDTVSMHVEVDWDTAQAGQISLGDSCGGTFDVFTENSTFVQAFWHPPAVPVGPCTLLVDALSADNWSQSFYLDVPLL
jgi:hypothetical protein